MLAARRLAKRLAARTALAHGDDVAPEALWYHLPLLFSFATAHCDTRGARTIAGNERLSPCTRARYRDASKRTRSRVSARSRPPRSPQKFARENRSRDPPLPHEHRLTLANVKWRPLLTSFSTLVRICPSSDSATMAGTLDRAADWSSRSRDASGLRDWTFRSRRTGTPWLRSRRARCRESLRRGPLVVSVAPVSSAQSWPRLPTRPESRARRAQDSDGRSPRDRQEIALLSRLGRIASDRVFERDEHPLLLCPGENADLSPSRETRISYLGEGTKSSSLFLSVSSHSSLIFPASLLSLSREGLCERYEHVITFILYFYEKLFSTRKSLCAFRSKFSLHDD